MNVPYFSTIFDLQDWVNENVSVELGNAIARLAQKEYERGWDRGLEEEIGY